MLLLWLVTFGLLGHVVQSLTQANYAQVTDHGHALAETASTAVEGR